MTSKVRAIHIASARREIAYYEARILTAVTDYQKAEMAACLAGEKVRLAKLEAGA